MDDTGKRKSIVVTEPTLFNEPAKSESDKNSSGLKPNIEMQNNIKKEEIGNSYKSKYVDKFTNVNRIKYVILLYEDGSFMQFQNNEE